MSTVPEPQPTGKYVYIVRATHEIVTVLDDERQANAWVAAMKKEEPMTKHWRVEKYHIERWTT